MTRQKDPNICDGTTTVGTDIGSAGSPDNGPLCQFQ
jgi:hypothetical protein